MKKQTVTLSQGTRTEFEFPDGVLEGVLPDADERDEAFLVMKKLVRWVEGSPLRAMLLGLVVAKGVEAIAREAFEKVDVVDFDQPLEVLLAKMREMLVRSEGKFDKREVALPAAGGGLEKIELPKDTDEAMKVIEEKVRAAKSRVGLRSSPTGQYI